VSAPIGGLRRPEALRAGLDGFCRLWASLAVAAVVSGVILRYQDPGLQVLWMGTFQFHYLLYPLVLLYLLSWVVHVGSLTFVLMFSPVALGWLLWKAQKLARRCPAAPRQQQPDDQAGHEAGQVSGAGDVRNQVVGQDL
jgi:hypothetical protein